MSIYLRRSFNCSSWRLALMQASLGSQHHTCLASASASASGSGSAIASAIALATRLTFAQGLPGCCRMRARLRRPLGVPCVSDDELHMG